MFSACFALPPSFQRKPGECRKLSCDEQQKNCGSAFDGCGGELLCGDCGNGQSCGGGGVANVCGAGAACTPESDASFCARFDSSCTLRNTDNCGAVREVVCGTCETPCSGQNDTAFCASHAAGCGVLSALDNCSAERTVDCGGCPTLTTCTAHACVALPAPTITGVSVLGVSPPEIRQGRGINVGDSPARVTVTGTNLAGATSVKVVFANQELAGTIVANDATSVSFDLVVPHGAYTGAHTIAFAGSNGNVTSTATVAVTPINAQAITGDDFAAGTPAAPFRSFAQAAKVAGSVDVIELGDGTYDATNGDKFTLNDAGAGNGFPTSAVLPTLDGSGVFLRAKNRRQAVFVGDVTTPTDGDRLGIYMTGTRSLTVEGIVMKRFERAVLVRDSASVDLIDVDIHDNTMDDVLLIENATAYLQSGNGGDPSVIGQGEGLATQNVAGLSLRDQAFVSGNPIVSGAKHPLLVQDRATANIKNAVLTTAATGGAFAIYVNQFASCAGCTAVYCTNCTLDGVLEAAGVICRAGSDVLIGTRYAIVAQNACIDF